jgi:hypothetical protein
MKGLKRALSLGLASVMALSLFTMTAFADEETTTSTDPQIKGSVDNPIESLPVSKTVSTTAGVSLPSEDYYIEMVPATTTEVTATTKDSKGNQVYVGPALTDPIVTYSFNAGDNTVTGDGIVKKSDQSFTLTFNENDANYFTHAGCYRYFIYEVKKNVADNEAKTVTYTKVVNKDKDYIVYDTTVYTADLYVNQAEDGSFVVTNTVVKKGDEAEKPTEINFTNTVNCANIKIYKTVEGTAYKKDELFTFHILIPAGGDTITLSKNDKIQAMIYDKNGLVNDTRSNEDGIVYLTVNGDTIQDSVLDFGTSFQLKSGEYLEIYAPVSMIYKVYEEDYSGEGYVTTATYTEKGDFAGSTTKGNNGKTFTAAAADVTDSDTQIADYKVNEKGTFENEDKVVCVRGTTNDTTNTVHFYNTRNVTVDTGVSVDLIPYVLVTMIAVCGAILLISEKKRKTNR